MGHSLRMTVLAAGLMGGLCACDAGAPARPAPTAGSAGHQDQPRNHPTGQRMKVTIGPKSFTATLADTPAAAKLRAMLPLTLDMSELNGNEKFFRLAAPLPADASNPGTIQAGDILLWQSDTVVLFYETFSTTYSYTRLGRVDDPAGLKAAVGAGNVTVRFEAE